MTWKRLESTTIDPNISEGLEARIADPLWLLARQWQSGEFHGEDAATPVLATITTGWSTLGKMSPGEPDSSQIVLDRANLETPLEVWVERESVWTGAAATRLSAQAGMLLLRALISFRLSSSIRAIFRNAYPLILPADDGLDPRGRRYLELMARRALDGRGFYDRLLAVDRNLQTVDGNLPTYVRTNSHVASAVQQWFDAVADLFSEPAQDESSWNAERMEYRFQTAVPSAFGEVQLDALEYRGGNLDWYDFAVNPLSPRLGVDNSTIATKTATVLPTPLRYGGMPASRFWEFEDGEIYFSDLASAPQDLARVVIAAYATVFGNDWFIIPVRLPVGTVSRVNKLEVSDNFGGVHTLNSTAANDGPARVWRFFELTGDASADHSVKAARRAPLLFLPPVLADAQNGRPREDVLLVRDEAANLAWAIERRIESQAGRVINRQALWRSREKPPPATSVDGAWRYLLATEVPEHWTPLVPVRLADDPSMLLQRGRMATQADDEGVETRGALGVILEPHRHLYIREEEVPKGGVRLTRHYQTTRDASGNLHLWMARRKGPASGDRKGRLRFDHMVREEKP